MMRCAAVICMRQQDGPAATANFLGAEFDERPKALSDQPMPASPTRANGNGAAPSTSSPYRRSHDDSDRSFVSNAWSGTGNAFASPAPLIVLDEGEQTAADATESDAGSEEAGPSRGSLLAVGLDAGPSTSLGGAGAGAADFGAAAGPSASISVHSPKQVSVASSIPLEQSYTSYTVSLTRRQPGAAAPQVTHVERRFRDIVSLHELLGLTLPGYILPSRPSR